MLWQLIVLNLAAGGSGHVPRTHCHYLLAPLLLMSTGLAWLGARVVISLSIPAQTLRGRRFSPLHPLKIIKSGCICIHPLKIIKPGGDCHFFAGSFRFRAFNLPDISVAVLSNLFRTRIFSDGAEGINP